MQADSKFMILAKEANNQIHALHVKTEAGYVINAEEVNELRLLLLSVKILRDSAIVNLLRDGRTPDDIEQLFGMFSPSAELIAKLQVHANT